MFPNPFPFEGIFFWGGVGTVGVGWVGVGWLVDFLKVE